MRKERVTDGEHREREEGQRAKHGEDRGRVHVSYSVYVCLSPVYRLHRMQWFDAAQPSFIMDDVIHLSAVTDIWITNHSIAVV